MHFFDTFNFQFYVVQLSTSHPWKITCNLFFGSVVQKQYRVQLILHFNLFINYPNDINRVLMIHYDNIFFKN